ncbi:hypothetical protein RIF29_16823 [Crotalaria pallida]|uniref:Uncharacterized protein n=1 Tax=Crotalaria pallida TaxID=3830 RepID=A0AAN9FJH9_CROPI
MHIIAALVDFVFFIESLAYFILSLLMTDLSFIGFKISPMISLQIAGVGPGYIVGRVVLFRFQSLLCACNLNHFFKRCFGSNTIDRRSKEPSCYKFNLGIILENYVIQSLDDLSDVAS